MKGLTVRAILGIGAPAFLSLSVLLGGCGPAAPKADFTFINGAEPESLDPHIVSGQPEIRICEALFEGLTARNGEGEIVPGIAESWEISKDGRTYTFHLRDAKWSNGDPITSGDFLNSWRRAMDPITASPYADFYSYVENGADYSAGKTADFDQVGVKAPDDRTLVVTLESPTPYFLDICSFSTLAPVHMPTLIKWGRDWIKPGKLVSDGPYVLDGWRINDRISLRKNPNYWNAANVKIGRIDALAITSATTAFNLYHSGLADLIMDKGLVPSYFVDALKASPTSTPTRSSGRSSTGSTSPGSRWTTPASGRRSPWRWTSSGSSTGSPARASPCSTASPRPA